jgi:hypothetical protein
MILGPRLDYVKRWAPENWPLAFWDRLHLLPQRDFRLIEGEMERIALGYKKSNSRDENNQGSDRLDVEESNGLESETGHEEPGFNSELEDTLTLSQIDDEDTTED